VEVRTGARAAELDSDRRLVRLDSGERLAYDRLLLATGARPRRLPGLEDALHLREVGDADRLRAALLGSERLQVVGAGFIGCEVAAAARTLDREVSVYESLAQPLLRVLGPELGGWLASVHRGRGVEIHLGVERLPPLPAPVLVAAGSVPETALAERAGLAVEGGILVDELGRTSAPGVYAAGDAASFWSPSLEARVRVEHFQTAQRHGFATGRSMAGVEAPFTEIPWFWSDQYDLNLQYAGAGLAWDETVLRGRFGEPPFSVFYLAGGRLRGAAGVGDGHTISRVRRLLERRVPVSRSQLEDPAVDLRRLGPS